MKFEKNFSVELLEGGEFLVKKDDKNLVLSGQEAMMLRDYLEKSFNTMPMAWMPNLPKMNW